MISYQTTSLSLLCINFDKLITVNSIYLVYKYFKHNLICYYWALSCSSATFSTFHDHSIALRILNIKDMYCIGLLKLYYKIKIGTISLHFHNFLVTETVLLNHKDIMLDMNEELLFPFLQENIKNATLNTNLDSWYYQQKTTFYNELSITAYVHL